jgi:heat shock protein HspQ
MRKLKCGDIVRDKITGFEGVIVSVTEYLFTTDLFGVMSTKLHDEKPVAVQYFDEPRLIWLQDSGIVKSAGE